MSLLWLMHLTGLSSLNCYVAIEYNQVLLICNLVSVGLILMAQSNDE